MTTRDGVRLDADVYRPDAAGPFPVLLMRQPYGRAIASTVVYAHPAWYAAHGYIVVIQDVRGRGTSAGEFQPFVGEVADGFDTVTWAAQLPGSSGAVGMYGFSYQGMTQLHAAATHPSALKTLCPAMSAYDLYTDWATEGGAFCLQTNLSWAIQLAAETARRRGEAAAFQALRAAAQDLPLHDLIAANPEILQTLAPESFYHQWLAHPEPGEYWVRRSPKTWTTEIDLPMLHIGGWFDFLLRGTLNGYQAMTAQSQSPQHLLVGPWGHLPWGRRLGTLDYGPAAASPVDQLQVRWFDQFLKGLNTGILDEPAVCLFEMGSNQWRQFESWPQSNSHPYFLQSNGLASVREDAGHLVVEPAEICPDDRIVHDPWRPVPALGGHAASPAGSFDRSILDSRTDVLTYTSAPLAEALHLAGNVTVEVWCEADATSYDLSAVLSEVYPDGRVYNFTQGYLQVKAEQPLQVSLQATCMQIQPGNALRLSLSAACFPSYAMNSGTDQPLAKARHVEAQIITLRISNDGPCPSCLRLPVVEP